MNAEALRGGRAGFDSRDPALATREASSEHSTLPETRPSVHSDDECPDTAGVVARRLGRCPVPYIGAIRKDGYPVAGSFGYGEDDVPIKNLVQKDIVVLPALARRLRPLHFIHR